MKNQTTRQGFTLIELLVVVFIIGILITVSLAQYQLAVTKTKVHALLPLLKSIDQAEQLYYMQHGQYIKSYSALDIQLPASTKQTSDTEVVFEGWKCFFTSNSNYPSHKCSIKGIVLEKYFTATYTICWARPKDVIGTKICQFLSHKQQPDVLGVSYGYRF